MSLANLIVTDQDFLDRPNESLETTKKSLNKEILDYISGMREKIDHVKNGRFDEILPELEDNEYDKAIKGFSKFNKQSTD